MAFSFLKRRFFGKDLVERLGYFKKALIELGGVVLIVPAQHRERLPPDGAANPGEIVLFQLGKHTSSFFVRGMKTPGNHIPCACEPLIDAVVAPETMAAGVVHDFGFPAP